MTSADAYNAIQRLAAALHELSYLGIIRIRPEIRLMLLPGNPASGDTSAMHAISFDPTVAHLLADAIEQLLADRGHPVAPTADTSLAAAVAAIYAGIQADDLRRSLLAETDPQTHAQIIPAIADMFGPAQQEDEDPS